MSLKFFFVHLFLFVLTKSVITSTICNGSVEIYRCFLVIIMSINIMQWCAGIGNYYRYAYPLINMKKSLSSFNFDIDITESILFFI